MAAAERGWEMAPSTAVARPGVFDWSVKVAMLAMPKTPATAACRNNLEPAEAR